MDIFSNWTIDNCLALASMVLMSSGGIFALVQWNSAKKLRRAEFVDKIINVIRFDKEMSDTMYIIDYEFGWYNENFHNNKGLEYKIDKLLSYFDYICYLYSTINISKKEFRILRYKINRICTSHDVQAYLWNLYHFSKKIKTDCSFTYIMDYGIENKFIKNEFKNNCMDLFEKHLNF